LSGPGEGDETEEDGAGEEQKKGRKKGKNKELGAEEDGQVTEKAGAETKKKQKKAGAGGSGEDGNAGAENANGKEGRGVNDTRSRYSYSGQRINSPAIWFVEQHNFQ